MNKNTNANQEERQLLKLIEKIPLPEEEKTLWTEQIRNGGLSEELAEEIRGKVVALEDPENEARTQAIKTRFLSEFSMLIRRWRFSSQSNNFRKH